jgi:hypothetical protein
MALFFEFANAAMNIATQLLSVSRMNTPSNPVELRGAVESEVEVKARMVQCRRAQLPVESTLPTPML